MRHRSPSSAQREPNPDRAADAATVERILGGETELFNRLVLKYHDRVRSVVARRVSDEAYALDVVQETFLRAYRGLCAFRHESSFYSWLYCIAINASLNHLDKQARRIRFTEALIEELHPAEHDTPEQSLIRDQTLRAIDAALDALPADQQEAIRLRELEGRSYEEIAALMDCPIGTVRSRIFRARQTVASRVTTDR